MRRGDAPSGDHRGPRIVGPVAADEAPVTPFSAGALELLADADRPGGWLLLLDRIRQSYVDLDHPTYLDFEYVQAFADVLDAMPAGPLAVTHVGGGGCTLVRYVAATRPGSPQIVLEPDEAVTALVRTRLPFARGTRVRIRPVDGRAGVAALGSGSADVVVVDAFVGGRVPADLTTTEFVADVRRVLRPDGIVLMNIADGPPGSYARRVVATVGSAFAHACVIGDAAVLKRRRFGNLVVAGRGGLPLPVEGIVASASRAAFPRRVLAGAELDQWVAGAERLDDAGAMRSPAPPDEAWRVGG